MFQVNVNTLLYETAVYLASSGAGTLGASIFYRTLPASPYDAMAVLAESEPQDPRNRLNQLAFQVFVRDRSVGLGLARAQGVFTALHRATNVWGTVKGRCEGQGAPGAFYRDQNDVPVWPLSFRWRGHA